MNVERHPVTDRASWLAMRTQDVTASVVGCLFGQHPYETRFSLWLKKASGETDELDSKLFRRGRILESAVAAGVAEETGWPVEKAEHYYRSPEHRIGGTPDYYVDDGERCILQCKTVDPLVFERDWTETEPPLWIVLQALTEAMLVGAPRAYVGAMVLTRDFPIKVYPVPRHPASEARIVEGVTAFWRMVQAGEQPAFDFGHDADLIRGLYPRDNGEVVDLSSDNRMPVLLADRAKLKARVKADEDALKAIDAEIKIKVGEAAEARVPGWKVTLKTQARAEHVVPASTYRVLRVNEFKAKAAAE